MRGEALGVKSTQHSEHQLTFKEAALCCCSNRHSKSVLGHSFYFYFFSGYYRVHILGAEEYFIYLADILGLSLELLNSYVYQETPII